MKQIVIGIEASNLNMGGGKTHLLNILSMYNHSQFCIKKIIIWGRKDLLDSIVDSDYIEKRTNKYLNGGLLLRYKWLMFNSKSEFQKECDILFTPSGLYFGGFRPYVTMSRNMLLFDNKERNRLRFILRMKIELSRFFQILSLKYSSGIIFISNYSKEIITKTVNLSSIKYVRVYHGISDEFRFSSEIRFAKGDSKRKLRLLYVSHVYAYKHHWNVVKAVDKLKNKGYDLELILVGGGDTQSIKTLVNIISEIDPENKFVKYNGLQCYDRIATLYQEADIFVYASTCENMPNILIEAMSASLPIVCSNYPPMPEFVKDAAILCDPLDVEDMANAIERLLISPALRREMSIKSYTESLAFEWKKTTKETFDFIQKIYSEF